MLMLVFAILRKTRERGSLLEKDLSRFGSDTVTLSHSRKNRKETRVGYTTSLARYAALFGNQRHIKDKQQ